MLSHFTQPIINFFNNLVYYLLIFAIILAIFSFIYLGFKILIEKKNYQNFKQALLFVIIGIVILGIILINRNIIFDVIKEFIPKF